MWLWVLSVWVQGCGSRANDCSDAQVAYELASDTVVAGQPILGWVRLVKPSIDDVCDAARWQVTFEAALDGAYESQGSARPDFGATKLVSYELAHDVRSRLDHVPLDPEFLRRLVESAPCTVALRVTIDTCCGPPRVSEHVVRVVSPATAEDRVALALFVSGHWWNPKPYHDILARYPDGAFATPAAYALAWMAVRWHLRVESAAPFRRGIESFGVGDLRFELKCLFVWALLESRQYHRAGLVWNELVTEGAPGTDELRSRVDSTPLLQPGPIARTDESLCFHLPDGCVTDGPAFFYGNPEDPDRIRVGLRVAEDPGPDARVDSALELARCSGRRVTVSRSPALCEAFLPRREGDLVLVVAGPPERAAEISRLFDESLAGLEIHLDPPPAHWTGRELLEEMDGRRAAAFVAIVAGLLLSWFLFATVRRGWMPVAFAVLYAASFAVLDVDVPAKFLMQSALRFGGLCGMLLGALDLARRRTPADSQQPTAKGLIREAAP